MVNTNMEKNKNIKIIFLIIIFIISIFLTSCTTTNKDKWGINSLLWLEGFIFPFLFVLLGGILGFMGTLWVQIINKINRRKLYKKRLYIDLKFVLPILVANYYSLNVSLGNFNKEILEWSYNMGVKYSIFKKDTLDKMDKMIRSTNNQNYRDMGAYYRDNETIGKTLKKISLLILESDNNLLSNFKENFQMDVLSIFKDIQVVNEEIDFYYFNFKMTFQPNITSLNYEDLNTNMDLGYKNVASLAKQLTDKIDSLLEKYY